VLLARVSLHIVQLHRLAAMRRLLAAHRAAPARSAARG